MIIELDDCVLPPIDDEIPEEITFLTAPDEGEPSFLSSTSYRRALAAVACMDCAGAA